MKWHLTVDTSLPAGFRKIDHRDKLLSIGSCFSQHIGDRLERFKWEISNNPYGILYNPMSIEKALRRITGKQGYTEQDLESHNDLFISMDHHGCYSGVDAATVIGNINRSLEHARSCIVGGSTILVTFGTAYYYVDRETSAIVGNCHKLPASRFDRLRLSSNQVVESYHSLINEIHEIRPELQWILTVSPVRHWKDGAADNHWSKSILTCAIRELAALMDHVHYFPAYELMMDELRDHRYYEEDLVHPNNQAVEYIWERFSNAALSGQALEAARDIKTIADRLAHRPIHPETASHKAFREQTNELIAQLQREHPYIEF